MLLPVYHATCSTSVGGSDVGHAATRLCKLLLACIERRQKEVRFAISLRTCYAMSGTDIACAATVIARAVRCPIMTYRTVLSGQDASRRHGGVPALPIVIRSHYAIPGTDTGLLPASLSCYAGGVRCP
eukprot:484773-Rhodomonas_salina.1